MGDIKLQIEGLNDLREMEKLVKSISANIKVVNDNMGKEADNTKKLTEEQKRAVQVQNQVNKNRIETTRIINKQNDALIQSRIERQKETVSAKQRLTILNAEKGSYEAINAALNKNIAS